MILDTKLKLVTVYKSSQCNCSFFQPVGNKQIFLLYKKRYTCVKTVINTTLCLSLCIKQSG